MPVDEWLVGWLAEAAPVLIYRAPQVAEELLRAVLGQLSATDRRRAGLEASLVAALFRLERYEEAEQAGARLLAGDTDPQRIADTAWLVAYATIRTGRLAEARAQITQRLVRRGDRLRPAGTVRHRERLLPDTDRARERTRDTARRIRHDASRKARPRYGRGKCRGICERSAAKRSCQTLKSSFPREKAQNP